MSVSVPIFLILIFLRNVYSLNCIHCTSSNLHNCFNGKKPATGISSMVRNCPKPGVCIMFRSKVITPEGEFFKTYRGCYRNPGNSTVCSALMTHTKIKGGAVEIGEICSPCATDLCNRTAHLSSLSPHLLLIVVSLLLFTFR